MNTRDSQLETLPERDQRFFEDYHEGSAHELGTFCPTLSEMVAFATHYDPQPMHVDTSREEPVIASGWYTMCLAMRLIADNYLSSVAGLASPGVDSIAWTHPVYPDDLITLEAYVESARTSKSKLDRGIVTTRFVARNAQAVEVFHFRAVSFVLRRTQ